MTILLEYLIWPVIVKVTSVGLYKMQLSEVEGDPPLQVYSGSILQLAEHPSPSLLFPSSHSTIYLFPSPQFSSHKPDSGLSVNPGEQLSHL